MHLIIMAKLYTVKGVKGGDTVNGGVFLQLS